MTFNGHVRVVPVYPHHCFFVPLGSVLSKSTGSWPRVGCQLGFVCCFLMITVASCISGRNSPEVTSCPSHIPHQDPYGIFVSCWVRLTWLTWWKWCLPIFSKLPICNWVICISVDGFKNSLHILDTSPRSDVWFARNFPAPMLWVVCHCRWGPLPCTSFTFFFQ